MTFQSLLFATLSRTWVALAALGLVPISIAQADDGRAQLAAAGLEVFWEANIGGAPLANGPQSFALWRHSTDKREFVTVRNGARVLDRILGNEIDMVALEKAVADGVRPDKSPLLGLEGATKRAEKLVATYKILGRKLDIEPFSQPLTYAVTLTKNGIAQAIDAETGSVLWTVEVGNSTLPTFGPGVSDEHVVVTNGNQLYVYQLATGNFVTTRKLMFTPTGCPTAMSGKAIVPSVDGRLIFYDIADAKIAPIVIRKGKENRLGIAFSADRQYFSWPNDNQLIICHIEKAPKLWTSINEAEPIPCLPTTTQVGFIGSTSYGTVFHCNTARMDSVLWQSRLAVQVTKPIVVNKELAFVVSDEGLLFALNLSDGASAWNGQVRNIRSILAVGKNHVYAKDSSNALVAIDIATGIESSRTDIVLPDVLPNAISDRLFVVTKQGQLTCFREQNASAPTFSTDFSAVPKPKENVVPTVDATKPFDADANMFEGAGEATEESTSTDDPFGIPIP